MGSTWVPLLKHPVWFVPLALIFLPLFSPLNASLQSYVINDAPVQIIKPSKDHKMLIIDKENMKAISKITGPVATIGVVGKFHSGKSFLMNQLMGKTKGFGIGPSVRPETMGIWMWGEPLKVQLPSGQPISLIFLDTEGFAATNVSENYDAKIFAIATLISSHLIYNSVKIIDQSEIDYLELLSRRTQLFALKSQLSQAKWKGEFVHDLLSFPPLLWVVQDFVQTTVNNETPTQWLHRLMETHTRESEEYKISLLDLFKSLECHTLFIPAFKRPLLTDLSLASEEDLTEEYIEERNALTKKLREVLVPKTKNGKPITGPELAGLLQVLVDAANEGSLADVPSRWSAFVDRLMHSAEDDCFQIYISDMNSLLEKHDNGPIHDDLLMAQHTEAKNMTFTLLRQLLHGLPDAVSTASHQLTKKLDNDLALRREMNSKRIKLFCTRVQNECLLDAEGRLKSIPLPTTSAALESITSRYIDSVLEAFAKQISALLPEEGIANYTNLLMRSLKFLVDSIQLKNEKAMDNLFENCIAKAKDVISSKVTLTSFLTDAQFDRLKKAGIDAAFAEFDLGCGKFSTEKAYGLHEAKLKVSLSEFIENIKNKNDHLVQQHMAKTIDALVTVFEKKTGSDYMPLPINTSELDFSLEREKSNIESQFAMDLADFQSSPHYARFFNELMLHLSKKSNERHKENVKAFAQVVNGPLSKARQIILISSHNYRTEFSLRSYIMQVCLLHLEDGKAKHWHEDLKRSVIRDFMNADPDLVKALRDVKGFWSSFLGFFLWCFWMLGINL